MEKCFQEKKKHSIFYCLKQPLSIFNTYTTRSPYCLNSLQREGMLEKYTDQDISRDFWFGRTPVLLIFFLMRMLFFILTSMDHHLVLQHQQDLVRKLLYLAVASLSNSEKQKPLFQSGLESSWQGGQGVREMELSRFAGYLS